MCLIIFSSHSSVSLDSPKAFFFSVRYNVPTLQALSPVLSFHFKFSLCCLNSLGRRRSSIMPTCRFPVSADWGWKLSLSYFSPCQSFDPSFKNGNLVSSKADCMRASLCDDPVLFCDHSNCCGIIGSCQPTGKKWEEQDMLPRRPLPPPTISACSFRFIPRRPSL